MKDFSELPPQPPPPPPPPPPGVPTAHHGYIHSGYVTASPNPPPTHTPDLEAPSSHYYIPPQAILPTAPAPIHAAHPAPPPHAAQAYASAAAAAAGPTGGAAGPSGTGACAMGCIGFAAGLALSFWALCALACWDRIRGDAKERRAFICGVAAGIVLQAVAGAVFVIVIAAAAAKAAGADAVDAARGVMAAS